MKDPKIAPLCDELGALEKELAPHKPKLDRIEMLRKELRKAADSHFLPNEAGVLEGERFDYVIGFRGRERHIVSMTKLFRAIGQREFLKRCSIALKHLTELGKGLDLLEWRNSGPRSLKCVERGTPASEDSLIDALATVREEDEARSGRVSWRSAIADATAAIEANARRAKKVA